jgi:hypothetical protein
MTSPLPSNMAMCTVRGRYGVWVSVAGQSQPQFSPFVGLRVLFSPPYPFVTNATATPSPVVVATAPIEFITDSGGYLSDPRAGDTRNCLLIASDDPDIYPTDWRYLVTFSGTGASNFRAFRTPAPSGATVDMAVLTPQRVPVGTAPSTAEVAAAQAAASAAAATAAVASIQRGVAGGVAPLDLDGDVTNAAGIKVLPGGSGGSGGTAGTVPLSGVQGMSDLAKLFNTDTTQLAMRNRIGAGTGNSNLIIGTTGGTAPDASITNTAIGLRAIDSTVIHRTGDEVKDGVLTFLDPVVIPAGVTSDNAVNKAQLDTKADATAMSSSLATKATDSAVVHRTGNESISGIKSFADPIVVPDNSLSIAKVNGLSAALTVQNSVTRDPLDPDVLILTLGA